MKLNYAEVVEAVTEELLCYEDMEAVAEQWKKEFLQWVTEKKGKTIEQFFMTIKDEDEVFEMADAYRDAIEENTVAAYWKTF